MLRALKPCGTMASYKRGCRCVDCRAANTSRVMRAYAEKPGEAQRVVAATAKWRKNNPDKERDLRLAVYGLTQRQWSNIFESQGSACGCCGRETPGVRHGWVIDHDHETGAVRGILCHRCNTTLGMLGDSEPKVIQRTDQLLRYLRRGVG